MYHLITQGVDERVIKMYIIIKEVHRKTVCSGHP